MAEDGATVPPRRRLRVSKIVITVLVVVALVLIIAFSLTSYQRHQTAEQQAAQTKARQQLVASYRNAQAFEQLVADYPGQVIWTDDDKAVENDAKHVQVAQAVIDKVQQLSPMVKKSADSGTRKAIDANLSIYQDLSGYVTDLREFYAANAKINQLASEIDQVKDGEAYRDYIQRNRDKYTQLMAAATDVKVQNSDLKDGLKQFVAARQAVLDWAASTAGDDALAPATDLDRQSDESLRKYALTLQRAVDKIHEVKEIKEKEGGKE